LSANPFSSIGFERSHNQALAQGDEDDFIRALLVDVPPPPADQRAIVAANRLGLTPTQA
jgi:hydroxyacylglutathione hydrolase